MTATSLPLPPPDLRIGDLDGRRVGVWGAGREGAAAVGALRRYASAATVVVVTSDPPPDGRDDFVVDPSPGEEGHVAGDPVPWLHGEAGLEALASCEVVIRSPGIPVRGADADRLRAAGVTITGGTALWLAERAADETVVGVTGTKGKSTTSSLLHHLLGHAGIRSRLAGNIGVPLLEQLRPDDPPEVWVVELSSYQLADLPRAPTIAVITNLRRDHLPWHGDEATYHHDKLRILGGATPDDGPRMAVLSAADPGLVQAGDAYAARGGVVLWTDRPTGFHVADGALWDGSRTVARIDDLPVRGVTGARDVALALEAVRALGHDIADPVAALRGFAPLRHRQEVVHDAAGVRWVDDSISTTPDATLAALAAFAPGPIVLLAGGVDRDQHPDELAATLAHGRVAGGVLGEPDRDLRVAGIVALPGTGHALADAVEAAAADAGRAAPPIRRITAAGGPVTPSPSAPATPSPPAVPAPGVATMRAAVDAARALAAPGTTVLLSPAAPSHGLFRDFEDRGRRFADAARDTPDEASDA
ncbi:MAG: UDP-N-acetylmuramoyl-L-alanine--D-glutamate ligase [Solirubrobacteraceae bacterium]